MWLVHGDSEPRAGHEVVDGAVLAGGVVHTMGPQAAQARRLGDLDELGQQRGGTQQLVMLQLHIGPLRTEGPTATTGHVQRRLALAGEQEPHQRALPTTCEQDQAVRFVSELAPGDDRRLRPREVSLGEQVAEPRIAGSVVWPSDEVRGPGRAAKDGLGYSHLDADNRLAAALGAGSLEADDTSQRHVVGEGKGAHAEPGRPRRQHLWRGGATQEAEGADGM